MEKIYKREDGSKVKLTSRLLILTGKPRYDIEVSLCAKGKRKFNVVNRDDYVYRTYDLETRRKAMLHEYKKHVTDEEIREVCELEWKTLMPTKDNINAR